MSALAEADTGLVRNAVGTASHQARMRATSAGVGRRS